MDEKSFKRLQRASGKSARYSKHHCGFHHIVNHLTQYSVKYEMHNKWRGFEGLSWDVYLETILDPLGCSFLYTLVKSPHIVKALTMLFKEKVGPIAKATSQNVTQFYRDLTFGDVTNMLEYLEGRGFDGECLVRLFHVDESSYSVVGPPMVDGFHEKGTGIPKTVVSLPKSERCLLQLLRPPYKRVARTSVEFPSNTFCFKRIHLRSPVFGLVIYAPPHSGKSTWVRSHTHSQRSFINDSDDANGWKKLGSVLVSNVPHSIYLGLMSVSIVPSRLAFEHRCRARHLQPLPSWYDDILKFARDADYIVYSNSYVGQVLPSQVKACLSKLLPDESGVFPSLKDQGDSRTTTPKNDPLYSEEPS